MSALPPSAAIVNATSKIDCAPSGNDSKSWERGLQPWDGSRYLSDFSSLLLLGYVVISDNDCQGGTACSRQVSGCIWSANNSSFYPTPRSKNAANDSYSAHIAFFRATLCFSNGDDPDYLLILLSKGGTFQQDKPGAFETQLVRNKSHDCYYMTIRTNIMCNCESVTRGVVVCLNRRG